ncbi:MAG: RIP metalloprotease RseP [Deltaproteobacteria bacterium]|nr:RIP metalloprotease RseP [Deltaproteobacteria bacterium]MBW2015723.1 RIP metalloprotease RseP [Deltaproteobacteria bacterium]MBW2128159.1 RIP metalloprotease RseP [Deltaproteobacteria bacterium]
MHFFLYYTLPFIVVLGVLIFFHELGHFLMAKYFRVKVLKFSLGFGPRIVGKTIGETEYVVSAVPLGGYVKMLGEDGEEEEPIAPEDEERAFQNQHVLKRMAIVAAGPVFNLILALFLFFGIYWVSGAYVTLPEIGEVTSGSAAAEAGLKKGDVVLSIQGKKIEEWLEMREIIRDKAGIPLEITVRRGGKVLTFKVTPREHIEKVYGQEIKSALIGIVSSGKYKKIEFGPLSAFQRAGLETWKWIERTCMVVVDLVRGRLSLKLLGGPIMIGKMTGDVAQESLPLLLPFMAMVSVNLGILNLFPIPILDGGLLLFLLVELVSGRPISLKKRDLAQKVGLAILIFLMIFVTYNDILKLIKQ